MMHTGIDLSRYTDEDLLIILGVFEHELDDKQIGGKMVATWKDGGVERVRTGARERAKARRKANVI